MVWPRGQLAPLQVAAIGPPEVVVHRGGIALRWGWGEAWKVYGQDVGLAPGPYDHYATRPQLCLYLQGFLLVCGANNHE